MSKFLDWLRNSMYWTCRSVIWGFPLFRTRIKWNVFRPEKSSAVLRNYSANFWEFLRPFFASHGLFLYQLLPTSKNLSPIPLPKAADPKEIQHPYGRRFDSTAKEFVCAPDSIRTWAARDALGHEVVIKVISSDTPSNEFQVLQYLSSDALRSDPQNHTIPVLKFLTFRSFVFAVIPRWTNAYHAAFENFGQITHFIDSYLEGLSFMHEHRICHGDILAENSVINIFDGDGVCDLPGRRDVATTHYAFINFESSRLYPPDIHLYNAPSLIPPRCSRRCNPFAFDVLRLGLILRHCFQEHIEAELPRWRRSEVHNFFHKMLDDEWRRPTAKQALLEFRALSRLPARSR